MRKMGFLSPGVVTLVMIIALFVEVIQSEQDVSSKKNSVFSLEEGNLLGMGKILRSLEKLSHRKAKCNRQDTSAKFESILTAVQKTQNSVEELVKSTDYAITKLQQAVVERITCSSHTDISSTIAHRSGTIADSTAIQDLVTKTPLDDLHEVNFFKSGAIAKATDFLPGYPPVNALYFGKKFWHSGVHPATLPKYLWFEFPENIRVLKYSFRSRTWGDWLISADGPSKYIFWATNYENCSDESQWDILYEDNSGTPFELNHAPKSVSIENSYFYRCYGFKVTDVPGRDRTTRYSDTKVGDKRVTISDVHFYSTCGV